MSARVQGRSRGFTLVEMSIVLVIIGLIIGGILKGQEIIASARQKATINQVNAVRAAANTYFDRYRALPGDDPNATSIDASLVVGNGNGIVDGVAAATATTGLVGAAAIASENYQFFNGLVAANLLNGAQVTSGTTPTSPKFGSSALPAAPITGAGLTVQYGTHTGDGVSATTTKTTHWLRLHKGPTGTPVAAVSARTLANIDSQIDDGASDAGGVRGDDGSNCNTQATSKYVAKDVLACIALFEITQ